MCETETSHRKSMFRRLLGGLRDLSRAVGLSPKLPNHHTQIEMKDGQADRASK